MQNINISIFNSLYPPVMDSERKSYYKDRFKLHDYHIDFYNIITSQLDFKGKKVLEIGGSNTPVELALNDIGARKWVCVDKPWQSRLNEQSMHYKNIPFYKFSENQFDEAVGKRDYIIFNEYADNIPESFFDKFDICISNSCFEHIMDLPKVIDLIHKSLMKNGVLYSRFGPIWSSATGNHLGISDSELSFSLTHNNNYPEELNHAHLLWGYSKIFTHLEENYGGKVANRYSFRVKNGDSVNKLFYEDYVFLMQNSLFSKKAVFPAYLHKINDETMELLQNRYPEYFRFDVRGVVMQALK